jgi:iron(III) transport system substrate-binding protein
MNDDTDRLRRRRFVEAAATAGLLGVAGCAGNGSDGDGPGQIGSGREGRPEPGGTPIAELPELSGTLDLYSGRGQPLVGELIDFLDDEYPDLTVRPRYDSANRLLSRLDNEGQNSPADVFFTVNAGALGALNDRGRAVELSDEVLSMARERFRAPDGRWVGTSGRVRTVPYNTAAVDSVPDDIFAIPEDDRFQGGLGWAPTYSSFQAFVTAMRILNDRERTKEWLEAMLDAGVTEYNDEFLVAQAVADGDIVAGLTNHYYIQRVIEARGDPPLATGNTVNDAGSIFNVAGAAVVDTADDTELAENFVRHLLSAEAQEYFAISRTFEYPAIPEVEPLAQLPSLEELNPPEIDLTELSDIQPTVDLLREVGIL